ncbi:BCCT family transporter [Lentibacillus cibarius]|uniref:BCCT family transporter n=1 Tax=Lentibacillus cibarius TaxID=2583219 RepID=A0A5S3QQB3_9BACI|nr:BCCT family transporter [Lentibacillus cibarius]TMN23847.1 BCCT family transporter [Lentibacillus cibarius]
MDWTTFAVSGGFLILFIVLSLMNSEAVSNWITTLFDFSAKYFGAYWQVLMFGNFVIGIFLGFSRFGKVRLGGANEPKYSYYRWVAMILVTLLASGGVFWAAAEPMNHYMTEPPLFGGGEFENIPAAFAQAFMHWGFFAWAILGTLATIVMMYVHYSKGYPMRPRALLFPVFGEKIFHKSIIGSAADIFSIIAIAAGTLGPLGFLGLQISYGLNHIFNVPNTVTVSVMVIVVLVAIAAISAATGVDRGILILSRVNVGMTFVLGIIVLLIGPTFFIIDSFVGGMGTYLQNFFTMSFFRGDDAWLGSWTLFFWGWFIGYGPMLIIFISRISRGRTIRELIIAVSIVAPLVTNFWFSIIGGTGVFFEIGNPGSVSGALNEAGMPAAVMAIMDQLPIGMIMAVAFLVISVIFVATTADTISYTVAVTLTGNDQPKRWLRVFWALIFGVTAMVILTIGEGSITAIQNSIVITAVPVSFLLLPPLWNAPQIAKKMALEQGLMWERPRKGRSIKVYNRK